MITVVCLWVQGPRKYDLQYVTKLGNMVERHLQASHEFVCLTDRPLMLPPTIRPIHVAPFPKSVRPWWHKMRLFHPKTPFKGNRILYLDLDVIITGDLDEVVNYPSSFAISPDLNPRWVPTGSHKVIKGFNSSIMVWDKGSCDDLWKAWHPGIVHELWGDQDLIKRIRPHADMLPVEWFGRISWGEPPFPPEMKVILCAKPKNHAAQERWPWFQEYWR